MDAGSPESKAHSRWNPPADRFYNRSLAALVVGISRMIMRHLNSLTIEEAERFEAQLQRGDRGLLTFSNHVSLFDDPLLLSNLRLPPYRGLRWVAADALNFFDSRWKSLIFNAGKCVPIVRGRGFDQPGFDFLVARLVAGEWVYIFPEGGRTRDPEALLSAPFKAGIGRLIVESEPILLPFYHCGMHEVLPIGSSFPRRRKRVRIVFGPAIDGRSLVSVVRQRIGGNAAGLSRWDAVTQRTYEILAALESEVRRSAVTQDAAA